MTKRDRSRDDSMPLDLVALSLAIWLALLTCVTGSSRLRLPLRDAGASNDWSIAQDTTPAYTTAFPFGI